MSEVARGRSIIGLTLTPATVENMPKTVIAHDIYFMFSIFTKNCILKPNVIVGRQCFKQQ